MPRAFSISATDIAAERERIGGDLRQVRLRERAEARHGRRCGPMGPRDVHLRILAVSLEHNVDHADARRHGQHRRGCAAARSIPGNSALGEVTAVGRPR